ncbi:putative Ntn-hydrolase superfamily protein [Bradyrhizobium sp. LB9.1b]
MTWSIIARDSATGQFGIAVATRFFAVGARVPYIAAGLGAIATQAFVNPYYGIDGVKLLREGLNAHDVLAALLATDDGRESRQIHIMDASGEIAAHTRARLRRLVRAHRGQRLFDRRQHARGRRRARRDRKNLYRQ